MLLAAAMIGGILLTAAALLLPWSRLLDNSKPSDSASPGSAEARIVLPRPSFKDFKLQVVTAGVSEVDGVLHSHVGDKLSLTITSERNAHLRVWFLNPNGDIIQLFPNSVEKDDRVQAKVPRQLPGDDKWWIEADEASPEAGYLRIVASTEVWDPLPGDQTAGPFLVFQYLAAPAEETSKQHESLGRPPPRS